MHSHTTITGRFSSKGPNPSNVPKQLESKSGVADERGGRMLLSSFRVYKNWGRTEVPAWLVDFRFTLGEGGIWSYHFKRPLRVYLAIVKEIEGPYGHGAIQLLSPKRGWIFDADLKRACPSSHGWRIV